MRNFGSYDDYSLGTIIGWLESQIENESEKAAGSAHDQARLDCAYDALELLHQVDDWTPRLTKAREVLKVKVAGSPGKMVHDILKGWAKT